MALTDKRRVLRADVSKVKTLSKRDLPALLKFYKRAYPDNWFDPHTLETGMYFGLMEGDEISAVAGVHVYSKKYRVAALGNIATAPEMRGRGLAGKVTAMLCRALLQHTEHIGLNVNSENKAAIACYKRLGFGLTAPYEEYSASTIHH
jgi:predicted GNAT family acetyltransferase